MANEEPGSSRRHGRTRAAVAGVSVVVAAAGVFAFPAAALAAPTGVRSVVAVAAPPAVSSGAPSPGQRGAGGGSGEPGDINIAMLVTLASLGLAVGVPLAGRARIARWRSVRRFRVQLGNVDTVEVPSTRSTVGDFSPSQDRSVSPLDTAQTAMRSEL